MDGLIAALIPLVILSIAWVVYCLVDLRRSEVRHLPKWGWALIIVFSVPAGGIVYLAIGRAER
jgi:hypothetical protein